MAYLLDTNIVTAFLKQNSQVITKYDTVRLEGSAIYISGITYYEIERGLLAIDATRKLEEFYMFCTKIQILMINDIAIIKKASEIYAHLKKTGKIIQDTDIGIAATAIVHNLILVSNDSDLTRIEELTLENWLYP